MKASIAGQEVEIPDDVAEEMEIAIRHLRDEQQKLLHSELDIKAQKNRKRIQDLTFLEKVKTFFGWDPNGGYENEIAVIIEKIDAERLDALHRIERQQKITNSINAIFKKAITCEKEEDLANTCLEVAQKLVGAKFGFFGEVNKEGKFDTLAISNPGWEECAMPMSKACKIIKDMEIRGMQFLPLVDGKSYIFNDPSNHPESVGVPEGHPKITCLLAIPLKYSGDIIGMIGLGNKEGGYDSDDMHAVEALSIAMVEALMRKRAEEKMRAMLSGEYDG